MFLKLIDAYFSINGMFGLLFLLGAILLGYFKLIQKKNLVSILILSGFLSLFFFSVTLKIFQYAAIGILILNTFFYLVFLWFYFTRKKYRNTREHELPHVTILIPVRNECRVIRETVLSLSKTEYPSNKLDIVVIDDGSTDETPSVLNSLLFIENLKVVRNETSLGKANALNKTLVGIDSEFTLVLDADHFIDKNFIKKAITHFHDKKVACVQGKNFVRNGNASLLAKLIQIEYYHRYEVLYSGRTIPFFMGSGGVFKTEILKELGGFNSNMLTEDLEISFRIYASGYRIEFDQRIATYELATPDYKNFFRQRHRWFRGLWQFFLHHLSCFIRTKEINLFSKMVILHNIIEVLALCSYLFLVSCFALDWMNLIHFEFKIIAYIKTLIFIVISGIAVLSVRKPLLCLLLPFITVYYILYSFPSVQALLDNFILKTDYIWNKTDRSAIVNTTTIE